MPSARRRTAVDPSRVFFALGEPTRLQLVRRLVEEAPLSVTQLGAELPLTRQGVTKHLRVLEDAGVVVARKEGRERLYLLHPAAVEEARRTLDGIAAGWDGALARLKRRVELEE